MERRVTVRDIAHEAGCHHTTVSLALRNDPRLTPERRARIQGVARAMGYSPDPMVRALNSYRVTSRPLKERSALAWLSGDCQARWGSSYPWAGYVDGAAQRAGELGYRLEEFVLDAPGMTARAMSRILRARGIQGILVAPQPWGMPPRRIELEWEAFSAVAFGYSLAWPRLNTVASSHFEITRITLRHLSGLGYRRIGLFLTHMDDMRSNGGLVGGYLAEGLAAGYVRFDPLILEKWDKAIVGEWIDRNRFDALVVPATKYIDQTKRDLGIAVPKSLGMVALGGLGARGYTHIHQQSELIGAAAVNQVVGMIHGNQRGIPEAPTRTLIEGIWVAGNTVRPVTSPSGGGGRGSRCDSGVAYRG